jgi:acetyltransferase-like isoleucine patch superfamily enzyme
MEKEKFFRGVFSRILHLLARFVPGARTLRPFLHRLRGVKVGKNVFIGEDVYIDNMHPEDVEIQEGATIALRSIIMSHFRERGKVIIEKNARIGIACSVTANDGKILRIGEGAVLGTGSHVSRDVPPFTFVGPPPVRIICKTTIPLMPDTSFQEWKKWLIK